jgi:hypothetical protein
MVMIEGSMRLRSLDNDWGVICRIFIAVAVLRRISSLLSAPVSLLFPSSTTSVVHGRRWVKILLLLLLVLLIIIEIFLAGTIRHEKTTIFRMFSFLFNLFKVSNFFQESLNTGACEKVVPLDDVYESSFDISGVRVEDLSELQHVYLLRHLSFHLNEHSSLQLKALINLVKGGVKDPISETLHVFLRH